MQLVLRKPYFDWSMQTYCRTIALRMCNCDNLTG